MGSATGSQRSTGFSLVRSRHEAWKPACWVSFAIYSERFEDWTSEESRASEELWWPASRLAADELTGSPWMAALG